MADNTDDLKRRFPIPEDGRVGLMFEIDRGGRAPTLYEMSYWLGQIQQCRSVIVTTVIFGRWVSGEMELSGRSASSATMFADALNNNDKRGQEIALNQLAYDLGLQSRPIDSHPLELQFYFVGAYRENPTHVRILAYGVTYAMAVLVTVFGAVQMHKEWTAEACRARVDDVEQTTLDILAKAARMEGGWSEHHVESQRAASAAAVVASRSCGSLLSGIGLKLQIPPGPSFEIRLGPSDAEPAPPAAPKSGR